MKKNNYTIAQTSCCGPPAFVIHESMIPQDIEEGTVVSEVNFKSTNIGTLIETQPQCCCTNAEVGRLQLSMYDQQLSIAETYDKSCLGLHFCSHEVVVMTAKRVLIGRIRKSWVGCRGLFVEVRNNEDKVVYEIRSSAWQARAVLPKWLSWLACGSSLEYEIVNEGGEVVGNVRVEGGCRQKVEMRFPAEADTKSKILLMNSVVFII